ncbi:hypothetical protein DL768_003759 [Monosporascus sp. mg162]|nr:hypothetical protein DL768_003759 [Monosporascus sp. mg162]
MWLINVHTYEIHEFFGVQIPCYAILSHTWGDGEVSFSDMRRGEARGEAGFQKIQYTCQQAKRDSLDWAWVDTCCIDKTSSAELSEAINSMYQWYKNSQVCYAFLADVPHMPYGSFLKKEFSSSRWFRRGWTLQELIAPPLVIFYNCCWDRLGSLYDLAEEIEDITEIPRHCLNKFAEPHVYSVATRMSWASKRSCTRIEDIAYCLFGLFDVTMPLLYGEGKKAFRRLQEEIIRQHDDHTILAWTVPGNSPHMGGRVNVLADSPANFKPGVGLRIWSQEMKNPSVMTKLGLAIDNLPFTKLDYSERCHIHNAAILNVYLNCGLYNMGHSEFVVLKLLQNDKSATGFYRLADAELELGSPPSNAERTGQIYIGNRAENIKADPYENGGIRLQQRKVGPTDILTNSKERDGRSEHGNNFFKLTDTLGSFREGCSRTEKGESYFKIMNHAWICRPGEANCRLYSDWKDEYQCLKFANPPPTAYVGITIYVIQVKEVYKGIIPDRASPETLICIGIAQDVAYIRIFVNEFHRQFDRDDIMSEFFRKPGNDHYGNLQSLSDSSVWDQLSIVSDRGERVFTAELRCEGAQNLVDVAPKIARHLVLLMSVEQKGKTFIPIVDPGDELLLSP